MNEPDERPGRALRSVLADFASGVTIVTTRFDGIAHAMTATAFCSVSLEPPLVLVCVGHTSRFHRAIAGAGTWAVSVLASDQETVARHFAHQGRDLLTQFDSVPNRDAPLTAAPLIGGALNWLECRTDAIHVAGDHSIVVGRVLGTGLEEPGQSPLTYYRGTYHRLGMATTGA